MTDKSKPPRICGARHPRGFTNVGPCQIVGEHDAHLFPHRAIAQGTAEVGFDTVNQRPVFGVRRRWKLWYDEPRAEWPTEFYPRGPAGTVKKANGDSEVVQ